MLKQVLIVTGPTGVGKTEFVSKLGAVFPIEIINADIGQMYAPLTIGTAKPDWQKDPIKHHLFDIICEPIDFTIVQFRALVTDLVQEIWARGKTPIIVGGSTLYIKSLFYAPANLPGSVANLEINSKIEKPVDDPWQVLNLIDPKRASSLHPNDYYRIQRALAIWNQTGVLPSQCLPKYDPIASDMVLLILDNPKTDLYAKIDQRVHAMMQMGWLAEVASLEPKWYDFLRRKKIIGYEILLDYCINQKNTDVESCIKMIQQRVRNYAKKQQTFWRSLCKDLLLHVEMRQKVFEINLTLLDVDLYIKQLSVKLKRNKGDGTDGQY